MVCCCSRMSLSQFLGARSTSRDTFLAGMNTHAICAVEAADVLIAALKMPVGGRPRNASKVVGAPTSMSGTREPVIRPTPASRLKFGLTRDCQRYQFALPPVAIPNVHRGGRGRPRPLSSAALFPQVQHLILRLVNHSRTVYRFATRKGPDAAGGGVAREQRPAQSVRPRPVNPASCCRCSDYRQLSCVTRACLCGMSSTR
jgi:hypothetical protein